MPSDRPYSRLRFSQLEMICEVADTGGVRTAAERMHLSAAAISKSLREIERSLGFELFERRARGMVSTARGERVLAHARLLLHELGSLADESTDARPKHGGLIRLAASPYVMAHALPAVLNALRDAESQGVRRHIKMIDGHLGTMVEQLLTGEVDALITLYAMGDLADTLSESIAIEVLREERIVIVAPPAILKPGRRKLRWSELAALPWILPPASLHLRRIVDTMFHRDATLSPIPVIEASSLHGNVSLSAAGLGLTIAPLAAVQAQVAAGALAIVAMQQPLPDSSLALIYRRISAAYLLGVQELRTAAHAAFG